MTLRAIDQAAITLTCWDCARDWQHARRRGIYPTRCPSCRAAEERARSLARRARARGLSAARAVHHEQHGWVCVVATPWHDQSLLRDVYDIDWVVVELAALSPQAVAA